jgi:DNA-binding Lrp family transcriptional regulator
MNAKALDRTDVRILDVLQRDASLSAAQVSERVGVTPPTAWRRIMQLEKTGVILGRHARIDPAKVGLGVQAIVRVKLINGDREHLAAFARAIEKIPEVIECITLTGDISFLLRVIAPDMTAYNTVLMDQLAKLPGLLSTDSSIVLATIKSTQLLPLRLAASEAWTGARSGTA